MIAITEKLNMHIHKTHTVVGNLKKIINKFNKT